jgi:3-hydroxyisobutyrate dehydrogenase
MGRAMCSHLLEGGYKVTVSTRSAPKAAPLLEAGALWAATPADVASTSDIVFTMVGYPADVREVTMGDHGIFAGAHDDVVVVDMSTSEPALALEIGAAAQRRHLQALDAPVTGGDVGAKNAALSIMVGGPLDTFEAVLPCLSLMGSTVVRHGGHGSGQHAKMTNQILIANNMVGVCEGLLYAYRASLDLEKVLSSVASGGGGSWSLANLAPRMMAGNMDPGFFVNHFVKDMGIALDEARRMHLALPGLALANQLYVALQAQGGGLLGTQALVRALASLSNIDWDDR